MQVVLQEYGARIGDDPEYVHEMRVAIRRARTAQELFGHYFRRSAIEPAFADLRRLGRRLGAVRDLDVALENLGEFRAGLPEAEQADVCKLEEFVQARRAAARQALLEWLDGPQHAATLTAFFKFTRSPGKGVKRSVAKLAAPAPLQVRHVMPGVIMARFARVRAYEPLVETESEAPAEQMHALRIECKYLRYSLEFSRHLLGKEERRWSTNLSACKITSAHSTTPSSSEAACSPGKRTGWTRSSSALVCRTSPTRRLQAEFPRRTERSWRTTTGVCLAKRWRISRPGSRTGNREAAQQSSYAMRPLRVTVCAGKPSGPLPCGSSFLIRLGP